MTAAVAPRCWNNVIALLRGAIPLYARGIALAHELLTDGMGPAYHGATAEGLVRS